MATKNPTSAPILELHTGGADVESRRRLYDARPTVDPAEVRRLYADAQRALEDLALALGPLDGFRGPIIIMANVLGSKAGQ